MKVKELMKKQVETLNRNDALLIAQDLMNMKRIRHLPVLDGGQLVGIISQRDLFHAALSSVMGYGSKAREAYLKSVMVKEAMTGDVITIAPDAGVKEAARLMLEKGIGCLPVAEGGELVGILSESDLVRLIAEERGAE